MRLTVANTFDDETGELKYSQYFADGRNIPEDEYCAILAETELGDFDEDCEDIECDGICEECDLNEEDEEVCECLDCTVDKYVSILQEVAPCPHCIEEVLWDFVNEISEDEIV